MPEAVLYSDGAKLLAGHLCTIIGGDVVFSALPMGTVTETEERDTHFYFALL